MYHHCFVFGDLNYRIDLASNLNQPMRVQRVMEMIERQEYAKLYETDQLRDQMEKKEVLADFSEIEPTFPPTFKVVKHAHWEFQPQRVPAYCDRYTYGLWTLHPIRYSYAYSIFNMPLIVNLAARSSQIIQSAFAHHSYTPPIYSPYRPNQNTLEVPTES
jgi:hypothetical protein